MKKRPFEPTRRQWLSWLACAGLGLGPAGARADGAAPPAPAEDTLEATDLKPEGERRSSHRARVFVPKARTPDERFPLLVLLHGLAETESEDVGIRAWGDRYGLLSADRRLRNPPVVRERPGHYFSDERLRDVNTKLNERPYRGSVVVCPYTPNVYKEGSTAAAIDRYAAWIKDALLPAVLASAPVRAGAGNAAIDGCSLGGYVALEVFLRLPDVFGALGGVQTAIGEIPALRAAERLRRAIDREGPRAVHIETSIWDPSLKVHELFSARLTELGVPHDLEVLPGGHDQIFLREVGTLEMLLWHDRRIPA